MSVRSPIWAALLAIAQSRSAVSVTPIAPSAALISFRAPGDEYDDCCSSFGYHLVIRGAPDCLREAFPAAYWRGRAEASFEEFGDVGLNGAPKRGRQIREGDTVTIATHAFSPCAQPYRGTVIYEQSYDNPAPRVGSESGGLSCARQATGAWPSPGSTFRSWPPPGRY